MVLPNRWDPCSHWPQGEMGPEGHWSFGSRKAARPQSSQATRKPPSSLGPWAAPLPPASHVEHPGSGLLPGTVSLGVFARSRKALFSPEPGAADRKPSLGLLGASVRALLWPAFPVCPGGDTATYTTSKHRKSSGSSFSVVLNMSKTHVKQI